MQTTKKPSQSVEPSPVDAYNILTAIAAVKGELTVASIASLLGESTTTIYRMAERRQIPAYKVRGRWKFDPSVIIQWLIRKHPPLAWAARSQERAAAARAEATAVAGSHANLQ